MAATPSWVCPPRPRFWPAAAIGTGYGKRPQVAWQPPQPRSPSDHLLGRLDLELIRVYCLLVIDASLVAIDYGSETSTKSWLVHPSTILLLCRALDAVPSGLVGSPNGALRKPLSPRGKTPWLRDCTALRAPSINAVACTASQRGAVV